MGLRVERDLWIIEDYATPSGERPVRTFIAGLAGRDRVEAFALIRLLEERGNTLRPPHSKFLGDGLFELRGHQVRIFYVFRPGQRIILIDGVLKKQKKIATAVLQRVRKRMRLLS